MSIGVRALAEYAAKPSDTGEVRNQKAVDIGNQRHNAAGQSQGTGVFWLGLLILVAVAVGVYLAA